MSYLHILFFARQSSIKQHKIFFVWFMNLIHHDHVTSILSGINRHVSQDTSLFMYKRIVTSCGERDYSRSVALDQIQCPDTFGDQHVITIGISKALYSKGYETCWTWTELENPSERFLYTCWQCYKRSTCCYSRHKLSVVHTTHCHTTHNNSRQTTRKEK